MRPIAAIIQVAKVLGVIVDVREVALLQIGQQPARPAIVGIGRNSERRKAAGSGPRRWYHVLDIDEVMARQTKLPQMV